MSINFCKTAALALSITALLCAGALPRAIGEPGDWQLVWADEFEKDGLPNAQWWDWEEGYVRNNESQYYTVKRLENARVEDGLLVIEARRGDLDEHAYTSASLTTRRSASWTYGKVEVRARVATGRGTWPAIWMLGDNFGEVGWPACGEIDIMEFVGYQPTTIHGTIHTTAYNHIKGTQLANTLEFDDLETAMHVYTLEWEPDELRLYVDGEHYFTFENDGSGDDAKWPFHRPQHLKLNLAIGGDWGGQKGIDDTIFPARFLIDYVRVYQRETAPPYSISLDARGPGMTRVEPEKESYEKGETVKIIADPEIGMRLGKWKNIQPERALSATVSVERDIKVSADFINPAALNRNYDFTDGIADWYSWTDATASAEFAVEEGAARIRIEKAGAEPWHIQFGQGGLKLESGKRYQLHFESWTSGGSHDLQATLTMDAEPYASFVSDSVLVTAVPTAFTIDYTHQAPTDANARIEFDLSSDVGTVYLDSVYLTALGDEPLPPYEAWKRDHLIRPIEDTMDQDGDGAVNLVEYLFQTNPWEIDSPHRVLARHAFNQSGLTLLPAELPLSDELFANFDVSTIQSHDLQEWTALGGTRQLPADGPVFQRLRIAPQPPIAD